MRNVAGLSTTDAKKSSDMFSKCRYMDELTGGRGVVFATGIGGFANGDIKKTEYPLINKMIKYANVRGTKVHGLGFTRMKYIYDLSLIHI